MEITLEYLKTAWSEKRIQKIKEIGFVIASDSFLKPIFSHVFMDMNLKHVKETVGTCVIDLIDAIWTDEHDKVLETKRSKNMFRHIFISEICDVAVGEYATVCELLQVKTIFVLGDAEFINRSKELLLCIPRISIEGVKFND